MVLCLCDDGDSDDDDDGDGDDDGGDGGGGGDDANVPLEGFKVSVTIALWSLLNATACRCNEVALLTALYHLTGGPNGEVEQELMRSNLLLWSLTALLYAR